MTGTVDKNRRSIRKAVEAVKRVNKDRSVMVDNCYGEFTETEEPTRPAQILWRAR